MSTRRLRQRFCRRCYSDMKGFPTQERYCSDYCKTVSTREIRQRREKLYKEKNREKINAQRREVYASDRERHLKYAKKNREKHRDAVLERTRRWRENNPEKVEEYRKSYRSKAAENARKAYYRNPEKHREFSRKSQEKQQVLIKAAKELGLLEGIE